MSSIGSHHPAFPPPLHPAPPPSTSPTTSHPRQPLFPTGELPASPMDFVSGLRSNEISDDMQSPTSSNEPAGVDTRLHVPNKTQIFGQVRSFGRHGSVRRNIDQQSNTFSVPLASVTSPPSARLAGRVSPLVSLVEESPGVAGAHRSRSANVNEPTSPLNAVQPHAAVTCVRDAIAQARTATSSQGAGYHPSSNNSPLPQSLRTVFCLFGSLERRISLQEVRDVFLRHQSILEPFYIEVLRIDKVFPPDFDLLNQLKNPSQAPDDEHLFSCPMMIWPLTTLFLVGCFLVTAKCVGYERLFCALQEGGLLMMGKGVFAALAVAESRNEEELIRNTSRHFRAAFCVGIAYRKKQLDLESLTVGCGQKAFSILVVNIPISALQLLIDQANNLHFGEAFSAIFSEKGAPSGIDMMAPHSDIQISRVISERSAVVVAHPLDLMRLDMLLVKYADETGIKIHKDFLPTPVPENSPFFNQGLQYDVCRIWLDMDFTLEGSDLMIPIFSPQTGGELKVSHNLLMEIAAAVTCVPQDLTYSLQNLRDGDVLLDYSPSGMRLGQVIAWTRRDIVCLAEPSDRVEASILPSPRRSARGDLICKTLGKCADIQEIINRFQWEQKPLEARIVHLSTSFITDLNLLIDLDNVCLSADIRSPEMSITSFPFAPAAAARLSHGGTSCVTNHISSPRALSLLPRGNSSVGMSHAIGSSSQNSHSHNHLVHPHPHSATTPSHTLMHAGLLSQRFVALSHTVNKQVINLYEVSPLIKYLEMQHRCVLTKDAVELAERLSRVSGLEFPPHTLLLCPTVLQLLEFWDGLEFLQKLNNAVAKRSREEQANRDAPPGVPGAAIRRRRHLKRATDLIYGTAVASPTSQ